jgi:hypothetical protein
MKKHLFNPQESIVGNTELNDIEKNANFIKDVVAAYYKTDKEVYNSKTRRAELLKVKQIAIYLCAMNFRMNTVQLGKFFGYDHSTIVYTKKKYDGYLEWDNELRKEIEEIQNILKFKVVDELKLEQEYYYVPLNEFASIKLGNGKSIILKGFTDNELQAIKFIDSRNGGSFTEEKIRIRKHINQKFYILEKKDDEKDNNFSKGI